MARGVDVRMSIQVAAIVGAQMVKVITTEHKAIASMEWSAMAVGVEDVGVAFTQIKLNRQLSSLPMRLPYQTSMVRIFRVMNHLYIKWSVF